jgi:hypothetical protein
MFGSALSTRRNIRSRDAGAPGIWTDDGSFRVREDRRQTALSLDETGEDVAVFLGELRVLSVECGISKTIRIGLQQHFFTGFPIFR